MAKFSSFVICLVFYSCSVFIINFKNQVLSEEISDEVKNVHIIGKTQHGDDSNIQTRNYQVKSFVQEKACDGKECRQHTDDNAKRKRKHHHRSHIRKNKLIDRDLKTQVIHHNDTSKAYDFKKLKNSRSKKQSRRKPNIGISGGNKKHHGRHKTENDRSSAKRKTEDNRDGNEKRHSKSAHYKLPMSTSEIKLSLPQIHGVRIRKYRTRTSSAKKKEHEQLLSPTETLRLSKFSNHKKTDPHYETNGRNPIKGKSESHRTPNHRNQAKLAVTERNNGKQHQTHQKQITIRQGDSRSVSFPTSVHIDQKLSSNPKQNNKMQRNQRHKHRMTNKATQRQSKVQEKKIQDVSDSRGIKTTGKTISTTKDKNSSRHRKKTQGDIGRGRNPYGSRRHSYHRAPPGVGRLEQRLHPSLKTSLTKLRNSMEKVLYELKAKVNRVNYEYENVYNTTRYDVMQIVRDQLKTITEENDVVYDAVLDASRLVQYVYFRAHNHGLVSTAPPALTRLAEMKVKDFSPDFRKTDRVVHEIRGTLRNVMATKRVCMRQESRTGNMIKNLKSRIPKREMNDITHISRRLITQQHVDMSVKLAKYRLQRYQYRYNGLESHVNDAKNMSQMSYVDLKEAQRLFLQNKAYHKRIVSNMEEDKKRQRRSVPVSKQELSRLSDRAYMHARNLQKVVEIIERSILPLISKASALTGGHSEGLVQAQVRRITERIKSLVKKFERKFDEIRIMLGDEDILRERCESLFGMGEFSDEMTPIDCEQFGFYSGSGDLPVSPTVTTSQPITTPPTKAPTTTKPVDKEEGSGTNDFEFIDIDEEKKKDTADSDESGVEAESTWWWRDDPLAGNRNLFREKLNGIALANRTKSEEIYQTSEKVESRLQAILARWNQFQNRMEINSNYVAVSEVMLQSWRDVKPFVEGVKQEIQNAHESISSRVKRINKKLREALRLANETLEKVKQSNKSDNSNGGAGINVIPELITAVDLIKSNMASIRNVNIAEPTPCKTVENVATKLRTDIAELRKKIDRARDITSSMQMTVSMSGESYTSVPVKSERALSPTTSFQMCVRPAGTDMIVARFYDNETVAYSIDIEDSVPVVTISNEKGEKFGTIQSTSSFDLSQWYELQIKRYGHTVEMRTRKMDDSDGQALVQDIAFPKLAPIQNSPVTAYIGGLPSEKGQGGKKRFDGCIGGVTVNGKSVALQNTIGKTEICPNKCQAEKSTVMVFEGDGYVKFPLRLISSTYKIDNMQLNFTTRQKDGIVLLLNDRSQTFQVLISITKGSLHVEVRTKRGTTVLRSGLNKYANGVRHSVLITFETDRVDVTADDGSDQFTAETSTQEITPRLENGIYLGGLGAKSQPLSGKAKLRSLIGCISHFMVSNKPIPLFMMEESKNVHLGRCGENIWTQCVWFTSSSTPIVLDETEDADSLYFVVSSDSKGTALQYKKGEKFNIEIALNADGILVYDIKNDETKKLRNSLIHLEYWYNIEITDKDSEVTVSFNGQKVLVPYESGGGWLFTNGDDDSTYRLTIGGSDESDEPLVGGISELLVNDKKITLTNYVDKHNLQGCHKQPLEPVEAEIIEKPICDSV